MVGEADGWVDGASKLLRMAVDHARTLAHEFIDLVGIGGICLNVSHQQSSDRHHLLGIQLLSLVFWKPSGQLETPEGWWDVKM